MKDNESQIGSVISEGSLITIFRDGMELSDEAAE